MDIRELYALFLLSSGVTTDSRSVKGGEIFFAIRGANFNGNLFAINALHSGASYVVVDEEIINEPPEYSSKIIVVEDSLKSLQELAKYHRVELNIPIVAITGTNGKTTTKELVSAVLSSTYRTCSTIGNLNNHIGLPLTILSFSRDVRIGVLEMGASSEGEIALLCDIAMPNYGLVTNVGKAHLQGFGSFDGVKRAKAELYSYLNLNGGVILYNSDDPHICGMLDKFIDARKIPYGVERDAISISNIYSPYLSVVLRSGVVIKTQLIGDYNVYNILAALTVGRLFEIDEYIGAKAIARYAPSNNRSQLVVGESNQVIMDAYNANPTSMEAALENFSKISSNAKVAIIGDMLELGDDSLNEHISIIKMALNKGFNDLILIGREFSKAAEVGGYSVSCFLDVDSAISHISKIRDSSIILKGSRGIALERLLPVLTKK